MQTVPDHEAVLRRAAFGAAPGMGPGALARSATPRCRWLAAVVLGGRGRYAAAAALLRPLILGRDDLLAALAGATLAAHRRQLGGHAAARPLDGAALLRASTAAAPSDEDGIDAQGAFADALLGLAADNLALGRLSAARRLAGRAVTSCQGSSGWRARVRAGWVNAEIELAAGAADAAVPHAEEAVRLSRERGALRHAVKSELVLAAALAATGDPPSRHRAADLAAAALAATGEHALHSLAWPAGLLAADLDPGNAGRHSAAVTRELHALLPAADPEGRQLARESAWVPI
ncbi:hypothetical protein [Qaidamihabitans albus]|uniref:hypothetical protein n=1 Tax=Qaidamihabitans albus TaxID=2795733 RepID=UPI0027DDE0E8|nr:hypothetical protein [Qaidamihabitans albus]